MNTKEAESIYNKIWKQLKKDAVHHIENDPFLGGMLHTRILTQKNLGDSLSQVLAAQLGDHNLPTLQLQNLFNEVYSTHKKVLYAAAYDMKAVVERDPACTTPLEPLLLFKGFQALQAYRASNILWKNGRTLLAQILQSSISRAFGVDIHPAATIGCGIMVDHATNIVIGETAKVGDNVSILHGVTLGGTGKDSGDRHPKIGEGVLISAHAQLIGNIKVGKNAKIGAGAVVLGNVPAHTTYAGIPAKRVGVPNCDVPSMNMSHDLTDYAGL
jgi:serine O-acetyltransferase